MRYLTVFFLLSIMLICFRVNGSDDLHPENFINSMYNADGFKADFFIESILNNKIEIDDKKVIGLLEGLPTKDLQIIRNTVYARHGYIFKNREQLEYFQRKEWYNPQTSNVVLSQDEQDIVTVVKKIEDCENVYFEDFRKLFITLRLPVTYSDTLKRNPIDMLMVRKFLKEGKERNQPYNAIGELHENK